MGSDFPVILPTRANCIACAIGYYDPTVIVERNALKFSNN